MNILLLNLTRFGDLLQSQAAVNDLTSKGHRVSIVCLGNFVEAAGLIRGLSHVFPLRGAALIKALDNSSAVAPHGDRSTKWHSALAEISSLRDEIYRVAKPDVVCNLTPSAAARMLCLFLAKSAERSGFALDDRGYGLDGSAWTTFLQGAALSRGVSPFNIVDLFRMIAAGQKPDADAQSLPGRAELLPPPGEIVERLRTLLQSESPALCKGFVALQLGASENRRRWPVASFATLGRILWEKEQLCPVLLGSKGEALLAEKYHSLADHPHISLCGRTGLEELAATLVNMRMLVTNDTGTMHLAAGLNVPVLSLFLATAQPFDTGPYLAGSCCLEPDLDCHPCPFGASCPHDLACREKIRPETAANLALSHLNTGVWLDPASSGPRLQADARIWLSEHDRHGCMSLRSLSGHEKDARTAWLMLQRACLHPYLSRSDQGQYQPPDVTGLEPVCGDIARHIGETLDQIAGLAELMLQQGKVLQLRPIPLMRERFMDTWKKIHAGLLANPWCASLSLLWSRETQLEGQGLPEVLEQATHFAALLRSLQRGLSLNAPAWRTSNATR